MIFSDLIGKTILSVDETSADNAVWIKFTDDTEVVIDTEGIGYGLHRPYVEDCRAYRS